MNFFFFWLTVDSNKEKKAVEMYDSPCLIQGRKLWDRVEENEMRERECESKSRNDHYSRSYIPLVYVRINIIKRK